MESGVWNQALFESHASPKTTLFLYLEYKQWNLFEVMKQET